LADSPTSGEPTRPNEERGILLSTMVGIPTSTISPQQQALRVAGSPRLFSEMSSPSGGGHHQHQGQFPQEGVASSSPLEDPTAGVESPSKRLRTEEVPPHGGPSSTTSPAGLPSLPVLSPSSSSPPKTGRWTKREDEQLRATVERFEAAGQAKDWKLIAKVAFAGARSDTQCLERWERVLKLGLVKGPWTPEEDDVVRRAVEQSRRRHGSGLDCNWAEVAKLLPGRLTKQVRERWQNHLNPALVKSPWTEEEDYLLVSLQAVLGNRWNEIARAFQGRSENAIKNRWNSKQRRTLGGQNYTRHELAAQAQAQAQAQRAAQAQAQAQAQQQQPWGAGEPPGTPPHQRTGLPSTPTTVGTTTTTTPNDDSSNNNNNNNNNVVTPVKAKQPAVPKVPALDPSDSSPPLVVEREQPVTIRNVCRNINFHKALVKATGNDPEINEAAAILVNKVSRSVTVQ